jgi:hypothetical protein
MGLKKLQSQEAGQTTSETLLITTLVAVAAISLWTIYGSTIRLKVSQVTAAVSGHAANYEQSTDMSNDLQRVGQIRASQKDVTTRGPDAEELRSSFE